MFATKNILMTEKSSLWIVRAAAFLVALIILVPSAFAQKSNLVFKGELLNSFNAQSCTSTDYADQCYQNGPAQVSSSCSCGIYDVDPDKKREKASGPLIGKASVAEIDFTFMGGNEFLGSGPGRCQPFFASAMITGSKDTEQIDMAGTLCASNDPKKPKMPLSGGYGITSSTHGHQGYGTLSGSINANTGAIMVNFKGPAS
ncbi:MAG TPA: hypothetical protein VMV15_06455 [Candidatus Binataceae bacterium]|nr:hypothetical protein [Candidatus Binataceae bacterium]